MVGHHAHILRGIEVYKGRPIYHGLGNFVTVTRALSVDNTETPEAAAWAKRRMELFGFVPDPAMPTYPFHPESRNTIIAECTVADDGTLSAGFIPCWIDDDARPVPVVGARPGGRGLRLGDRCRGGAGHRARVAGRSGGRGGRKATPRTPCGAAMSAPILELSAGRIAGSAEGDVQIFRGIPYAGSPTGAHRFGLPPAVVPWTGIREATSYGPTAVQPPPPPARLDEGAEIPQSEDCLVLNVWTAGLTGARPVLFWIHGGGFSTGSGSAPWYDGSALAARGDVVVVTVNHRLGLLGFLDLAELVGYAGADSANAGMLDLVAALRWVREHIASFGGDPGRVTIFGESGGGGKVATLLAMPDAAGLFHRAAIQSGIFRGGPGQLLQDKERARAIARRVVAELGSLDELLRAPAARLLELQRTVEAERTPGTASVMAFCPTVDGRVVTDHPQAAVSAGASAQVPLIIGTNRDEVTLFLWLSDEGFRADPPCGRRTTTHWWPGWPVRAVAGRPRSWSSTGRCNRGRPTASCTWRSPATTCGWARSSSPRPAAEPGAPRCTCTCLPGRARSRAAHSARRTGLRSPSFSTPRRGGRHPAGRRPTGRPDEWRVGGVRHDRAAHDLRRRRLAPLRRHHSPDRGVRHGDPGGRRPARGRATGVGTGLSRRESRENESQVT